MNPSSTSPADVAAMFDLPQPSSPPPDESDTEAAQAALAADVAAAIASGDVADDAPDSRTFRRVEAAWRARLQWPGGRVIELDVRNISEGGVGLASDEPIPAHAIVDLELAVPPLDEGGAITAIKGSIRTTYTVTQGSRFHFGGTWQAPPVGAELVDQWIARL